MVNANLVSLSPAFANPVCLPLGWLMRPVLISPANHLTEGGELGPVCHCHIMYTNPASIYHANYLFEIDFQERADGHPVQH